MEDDRGSRVGIGLTINNHMFTLHGLLISKNFLRTTSTLTFYETSVHFRYCMHCCRWQLLEVAITRDKIVIQF